MSLAIRKYVDDTTGTLTPFGLFLLVAIFAVGGLAIDVTNAIRARTYLQIAADSAAHAALYSLDKLHDPAKAKAVALSVAQGIMPSSRFGNTITASDIEFGKYNAKTGGFLADPTSNRAVLVNAERVASRNNSVGTFFLKLVGFNRWNLVRQSVFVTYKPACMREGYVAQGEVNVQSGNHFYPGFCIHSNTGITVSSNNLFDSGVVVSMPSLSDLTLPSSGFTTNIGLQDSLRNATYKLPILQRINDIIAGINDPTSPYYRSYLTPNLAPVSIPFQTALDKSWQQGMVMVADCKAANQLLSASQGAVLKNGVVITNCSLQFPADVALQNVAIISTNTLNPAVSTAGTFTMGLDDNCADGGDAQIITLGGVQFAAGVSFYGAQVIAAKDIVFQSNADGMDGVSLVAGGVIDGTSNANIGFCNGKGMNNNFEAWYFRMGA